MIQWLNFFSGPCIPENVQSFTHCENNLGSVSWGKSDGAESYLAIAKGQDGHVHVCTTNTTSCTWDDLHCGELYTVHVIANDQLCSSLPSNGTSIRMGKQDSIQYTQFSLTYLKFFGFPISDNLSQLLILFLAPCIPQNLKTSLDCRLKVKKCSSQKKSVFTFTL